MTFFLAPPVVPSFHGDTRFGLDDIDPANGVPWRALRAYRPIPDPANPELGPFGTPRHWLQDPSFDGAREHQETDSAGQTWVVPGGTFVTDSGGFFSDLGTAFHDLSGGLAVAALPFAVAAIAPAAVAAAAPAAGGAALSGTALAEEVSALGGTIAADGAVLGPIAPVASLAEGVNVAEEVARLGGNMSARGEVLGPIAPGTPALTLPALPGASSLAGAAKKLIALVKGAPKPGSVAPAIATNTNPTPQDDALVSLVLAGFAAFALTR